MRLGIGQDQMVEKACVNPKKTGLGWVFTASSSLLGGRVIGMKAGCQQAKVVDLVEVPVAAFKPSWHMCLSIWVDRSRVPWPGRLRLSACTSLH